MLVDSIKDFESTSTASISFQYFVYDITKMATERFQNMRKNMEDISERYLEMSNLVNTKMIGGASYKYDKNGKISQIIVDTPNS